MHRAGPREQWASDDLTDAPRAVVLVGEAAKGQDRIDALLTANVIVILLPSLETVHSLITPRDTRDRAAPQPHAAATVGNLRVDLTEHRVLLGQRELPVTERELAILARLCEEPGRARSFAELAEPEGRDWLGDTERVHAAIRRLRRKLAEARVQATIESVRGYGFRIVGRSVDPPPVIRGGSGPLPEEVMATNRMSRLKDRLTKMQLSRGCVGSIRSVPPVSLLLRFCTALPIPWRDRHDQSGSEHVAVAATGTHLGG